MTICGCGRKSNEDHPSHAHEGALPPARTPRGRSRRQSSTAATCTPGRDSVALPDLYAQRDDDGNIVQTPRRTRTHGSTPTTSPRTARSARRSRTRSGPPQPSTQPLRPSQSEINDWAAQPGVASTNMPLPRERTNAQLEDARRQQLLERDARDHRAREQARREKRERSWQRLSAQGLNFGSGEGQGPADSEEGIGPALPRTQEDDDLITRLPSWSRGDDSHAWQEQIAPSFNADVLADTFPEFGRGLVRFARNAVALPPVEGPGPRTGDPPQRATQRSSKLRESRPSLVRRNATWPAPIEEQIRHSLQVARRTSVREPSPTPAFPPISAALKPTATIDEQIGCSLQQAAASRSTRTLPEGERDKR
ncbi:uncharacterized protein LTR77_003271 [Saxophila tyrrhenica]|uniref:Uncharacterized protein n=1 Tax=Saxophila tyrrhenica TaxID=1690608 RepID=A0AAV9PJQ7_9PEZI|nr:hypothetical protein LTR77_003271 [Saxophila tyrrhenica]